MLFLTPYLSATSVRNFALANPVRFAESRFAGSTGADSDGAESDDTPLAILPRQTLCVVLPQQMASQRPNARKPSVAPAERDAPRTCRRRNRVQFRRATPTCYLIYPLCCHPDGVESLF